ncbi:MAG: GpE family phage tail protein [Sphingomonas sp.]|jgi:hypothetical protein
MADLATVFHWSPDVMNPMSVTELMAWRERAAVRNTPDR